MKVMLQSYFNALLNEKDPNFKALKRNLLPWRSISSIQRDAEMEKRVCSKLKDNPDACKDCEECSCCPNSVHCFSCQKRLCGTDSGGYCYIEGHHLIADPDGGINHICVICRISIGGWNAKTKNVLGYINPDYAAIAALLLVSQSFWSFIRY